MEVEKNLHVLLVDDNPDQVFLIRAIAEQFAAHLTLTDVNDGPSALQLLRGQPPYDDTRPIDVVLLDLNMPGMSGWAVLDAIRHDEILRGMPVVILTSSTAEADIRRAYREMANSYIAKPSNLNRFGEILTSFESYWRQVAVLPASPVA